MTRATFTCFACEPRRLRGRRETWLADLQRDVARIVRPGDEAAVLSGDPRDGLALALGTMRWGLANPWLAAKGQDPLAGPTLFVPIAHAASISQRGRRCLVPVTSIIRSSVDGDRRYRDPDQALLTLAAIADWVEAPAATARFGLLTDRISDGGVASDAPLIVAPAHHDEWLDGWGTTADLRTCGQPMWLARLVVDDA